MENVTQMEKAVEDFTRAISLKPDYVHAYAHRALAYNALGKSDDALRDFNKVISIHEK